MNKHELTDEALDALLRASAPEPLRDDGFVARTTAAVDQAARALPARRRPAAMVPIAIARALAAEHRRRAAQTRLWRWASGGVAAGVALLVVAIASSPGARNVLAAPPPQQWLPLCTLAAVGALWLAWREVRRS